MSAFVLCARALLPISSRDFMECRFGPARAGFVDRDESEACPVEVQPRLLPVGGAGHDEGEDEAAVDALQAMPCVCINNTLTT